MTPGEFAELAVWLRQKSESVKFGEIVVRLICHDGARYVEKTVSEKNKIEA